MPVISSIFLVVALVLAVVIGPQTRPWTWGPAMLALGFAIAAALPSYWKRGKNTADFGILAIGILTAGWFAFRALTSPIAEFGQADLLLLTCVVGSFVCVRAIAGNPTAERILAWGIALLLLANVLVICRQLLDPGFSPIFRTRPNSRMISGFFAHYNETANYLIAASMLVAGVAVFGNHHRATRILWIVIAIAGLASVWFTRSRGGILGAAVACGVFAAVLLIVGKRRNARWFAPAMIAIPLIGIGIGLFLYMGWNAAQELRESKSGIEGVLDNDCRLYFIGMALSCIQLHPLAGGGSRSFSWECFQFADYKAQGNILFTRPDMVHNELIQSATDYGLIGAFLLVVLLAGLALLAIVRCMFEEKRVTDGTIDAWRLGALAGLAGMLVQSCFSFVFHLLPGIILLGICLGKISRSSKPSLNPQIVGSRILLTVAAILCVAILLPMGWKGTRTTLTLWPTYFSKGPQKSAEFRIDALDAAIRIWPLSTFYQERASIYQEIARSSDAVETQTATEQAIRDYQKAFQLSPRDPSLALNTANLFSQLHRDSEAEEWYSKAIQLQGGMERAYNCHYFLSTHFFNKALRLYDPAKPELSHQALESAAEHVEISAKMISADGGTMLWKPRITTYENLGIAREAVGDREGALESYNFAASLHGGTRAHYRAGVLIGKMAVEAWSKRQPAQAMYYFIEARKRITQAGGALPEGVSGSQRVEYIDYLDRMIAFLKGAKVEPSK
ncbi:MAG: O-antigen ligase family protein [Gloeobacteraceae cyanobacterium ES-bin-144]|nr:O-antigen ligase family protein [Verrucomicrobiales bacterium]